MKSDFADYWYQAAEAMVLVPIPPKRTSILPGEWAYDVRNDNDGYILEFRARWVVCGNRQTPGVDFQPDERYSPVVSDAAAKWFLSLAAIRGFEIDQWDVVGAYLNAAVDNRVIFMK